MMHPMEDRNYLLVLAAIMCMWYGYSMTQAVTDYSFTVKHGIVWC
jgi:hypothetical protein